MRFGPSVGMIEALGLLGDVDPAAAPTWFTHDVTLIVLGVLAAGELMAHKSPEARELLNRIDLYAKPVAAGLTWFGIASVTDVQFIDDVTVQAGAAAYVLAGMVVAGTFVVALGHNEVFGGLMELDESDDTGVVSILRWGQDLWSAFGVLFLILFPIVMGLLILAGLGVLFLLRRRAAVKEEQSRITCATCGKAMYRCAVSCPHCATANPAPTRLNWLGASTYIPTHDRQRHPLQLLAFRRCRTCGTRLAERTPHQSCPACGARPFSDHATFAEYDRMIAARVPVALMICAALSLMPVVGLVPGVIYYRMALVAPYRRYLGRGRAILLRWAVRLLLLFLIALQWIPVVGMFAVPAMAIVSFLVYRRAFWVRAHEVPAPAPERIAVGT